MTTIPDPGDRQAIAEFVRRESRGVVATIGLGPSPEAALVGLAAMDDGTLVFDSPSGYRKVENILRCDRVAVVVGTCGDVSVQIEGTARVPQSGDERDQLGRAYVDQFPGSRALADGFVVVGVRPSWVRVYDASTDPPVINEARWRD